MARDLGEQERAFIDALAADTGRDLPAWMQAIAQSGHGKRNDIIDWLRHNGFTFSNASWLERIHHNGGRLIYGGTDTRAIASESPLVAPASQPPPVDIDASSEVETSGPVAPAVPSAPATALEALQPAHQPVAAVETEPRPDAPAEAEPAAASDAEISTLLMAAKGLRPLADVILREMDLVVPAMVRANAAPFVTLASPMPFAALLPGPKEVRLYADFGPGSRDRTRKAETARFTAPFTDVIVLNDARQIDERFRELVAAAYTRALK